MSLLQLEEPLVEMRVPGGGMAGTNRECTDAGASHSRRFLEVKERATGKDFTQAAEEEQLGRRWKWVTETWSQKESCEEEGEKRLSSEGWWLK